MKIILESTSSVVELLTKAGAKMEARMWEGKTADGTPVIAYITRISPAIPQPLPAAIEAEFARELRECVTPSVYAEGIPLRFFID